MTYRPRKSIVSTRHRAMRKDVKDQIAKIRKAARAREPESKKEKESK